MLFSSIGHERLHLPDPMRAFFYQGQKLLFGISSGAETYYIKFLSGTELKISSGVETYYLEFHQGQKRTILSGDFKEGLYALYV